MIAVRKRPQAPLDAIARGIFPRPVLACVVAVFLFALATHSPARAQ